MECKQKEVCDEIFNLIEEKINVANHRIYDLEQKESQINIIANTLTKLETIICLLREDCVKRDLIVDDMNKSQQEIANTLKILSNNLNKTDESVEGLNKKVDKLNEKVDKNNEKLNVKFKEIISDNHIKVSDIVKKALWILLGGALTVGVYHLFGLPLSL